MGYIGLVIIIAVEITAVIIFYIKFKKYEAISSGDLVSETSEIISEKNEFTVYPQENEFVIQMEMLPAEAVDETKLVEITDSKVLAHVNNLIPGLAQFMNSVNNVAQAVQSTNGEVLYRAVIPSSAKLTNSKAMEGAVRGIYRGEHGIKGHANLVKVKEQKVIAGNTVATAMGVASMVVGQYYMTQINAKLGEISDGISQIQNFQNNEYRSRVFSLVAHIKKIADFQTEILENDELRLSKIAQLDSLEEESTQLLGQANLTLADLNNKTVLNYEDYKKEVGNAQNWFMYQKLLLEVLYKISDLRYTLHLGAVSREQCVALLPTYKKQVSDTQERLTAWHIGMNQRLGIETDEIRRKRAGFDSVIHFIPGLFNDDFNLRSIENKTVKMIIEQVSGHELLHVEDKSELYAEDVQLISKDGKIYYLPERKEN